MMAMPACIAHIPGMDAILKDADHVDVKSAVGSTSLRAVVAGTFTYQPRWVTALVAIRWAFVRLLGMTQDGVLTAPRAQPEDVPLQPGETFEFLTVKMAEPDRYWVGSFDDKHLSADVAVAAEPLDAQRRRFYVMTVVHYNHWTGPLYFNVIRPFHHLIVFLAVRSAARQTAEPPAALAREEGSR